MMSQLADLGTVARSHDEVALTGLGHALAAMIAFSGDLDLDDRDAQSLLLVCAEEFEPVETDGHLLAWCRARPAVEAVVKLCEAMMDEEEPEVWRLAWRR